MDSMGFSVLLTERQAQVLEAVVRSYVGEATPVGSETISALLPVSLSSASVRNTLAELMAIGLVEKPHRSAGRTPTEAGFRAYVDQLLQPPDLGDYERRRLSDPVDGVSKGEVATIASRLLSERTRQLGFMAPPRLDRVVLRHVSFVRLSTERVLVVLVSQSGTAYQRVIEEPGQGDQASLDRMAAALCEWVAGRSLRDVRDTLHREAQVLRGQAELLLERALRTGTDVGTTTGSPELVIATRLALLDQPEFHDPERVRELFQAVEDTERLADILEQLLGVGPVHVTFGGETDEPGLRSCALVTAPYGPTGAPLGVLGVIGPRRMDFGRVISTVGYLSKLVTEKLSA